LRHIFDARSNKLFLWFAEVRQVWGRIFARKPKPFAPTIDSADMVDNNDLFLSKQKTIPEKAGTILERRREPFLKRRERFSKEGGTHHLMLLK
jgi:hypothetical protein